MKNEIRIYDMEKDRSISIFFEDADWQLPTGDFAQRFMMPAFAKLRMERLRDEEKLRDAAGRKP